MALPSQAPRVTRHAAFRSAGRRRGNRRRTLALLAVCALVVLGVWWILPSGAPDQATANDRVATNNTPNPAATAEPTLRLDESGTTRLPRPITERPARPVDTIAGTNGRADATPSSIPELGPKTNTPAQPAPQQPAQQPPSQPPSQPQSQPVTQPTEAPASTPSETQAPPPTFQTRQADARDAGVGRLIASGEQALASNQPVEARQFFNRALHHSAATEGDRRLMRQRLASINEALIFSPVVTPGDAMVETYTIKSGDSLTKIVAMHDLDVDWRFVARVNKLADPRRIRVGQTVKLVKGPFHAVVDKSEYRLDLYADRKDPDGNRIFIRSFSVGLGEYSSTPIGKFVIRPSSKLINPHWVNPRTGERFDADNPENPIGERWLGFDGIDDKTKTLSGYGLHGTIEPQSIGKDASMGCVRMLPDDIEVVYEMLAEGRSTVEIVP